MRHEADRNELIRRIRSEIKACDFIGHRISKAKFRKSLKKHVGKKKMIQVTNYHEGIAKNLYKYLG